jgi:hypothetical protein
MPSCDQGAVSRMLRSTTSLRIQRATALTTGAESEPRELSVSSAVVGGCCRPVIGWHFKRSWVRLPSGPLFPLHQPARSSRLQARFDHLPEARTALAHLGDRGRGARRRRVGAMTVLVGWLVVWIGAGVFVALAVGRGPLTTVLPSTWTTGLGRRSAQPISGTGRSA